MSKLAHSNVDFMRKLEVRRAIADGNEDLVKPQIDFDLSLNQLLNNVSELLALADHPDVHVGRKEWADIAGAGADLIVLASKRGRTAA